MKIEHLQIYSAVKNFLPTTCILSNTNLSLIVKNPQHIGTNTQCT